MESDSKPKKATGKNAVSQSPSNSDQTRNLTTKLRSKDSIDFANLTVQSRRQSKLGTDLLVQTKNLEKTNLTDNKLPVIV
jgi:hypothetical protein